VAPITHALQAGIREVSKDGDEQTMATPAGVLRGVAAHGHRHSRRPAGERTARVITVFAARGCWQDNAATNMGAWLDEKDPAQQVCTRGPDSAFGDVAIACSSNRRGPWWTPLPMAVTWIRWCGVRC